MAEVNLPEGWTSCTVESLGNVQTGNTPSKSNPEFFGGNFPMFKPSDLDLNGVLTKATETLTDAGRSQARFIPRNSTYVTCIGATIGKTGFVGVDGTCNQQINTISPYEHVIPKWVYYLMISSKMQNEIKTNSSSTTLPILNKSKFMQLHAVLAPLAEQKVIADKLDTLLAQVETTKARLERIPEILKSFRQSVLAAAVSGKLTEEWRAQSGSQVCEAERLEEIRTYKYQSWLAEQEAKFEAKGKLPKNEDWKEKYQEAEIDTEFHKRELPKGWVFQPLDGLVYISARIGWKGLKASEYTEIGPLFLSVHSLNYGREVKLSEAFHISKERYDESPEIMLQNDDILLCKDGAGIGKIGIVKNLSEEATINSSLLLIRSGKFFVPEFLYFFLAGPTIQRLVQERMTGTAVPHLFQRDVKEFVLEVPPLEEQTEIVRRVEQLFAFADSIEQKANSALARVNNLTQSILAKAFRGELTADWRTANPDLITGDNSAESLLAKIKAERAKLSKKTKAKA